MKSISPKYVLAIALLAIISHQASAQSFLTNGLVAYYPFNGNANDASGNGNNASSVNATLTTDRNGNPNGAYYFDGVDNFIAFTNVPLTQVDNWTMTAWLKPGSLDQSGVAVSMGYDDGSSANGYSFGISGTSFQSKGNQLWAIFGGTFGAVNLGGYTFTTTNTWYQVAMVRTSGITQFYVNGAATPPSGTSSTPYTPSAFKIGSENGVRFFNGAIDDVRIYNRGFSSNEVSELYTVDQYCSPHAAQATPIVVNGFLVGANITDPGCGYTNAPLVLIDGGSGSGAIATAVVQNGFVTSINISDPGCCYTNPPFIEIASPPFTPTLSIAVSRVNVTVHVTLGLNYVIDSSTDLINWTPTGPSFTATNEYMTTEYVVNQTGQYFRVRQVP